MDPDRREQVLGGVYRKAEEESDAAHRATTTRDASPSAAQHIDDSSETPTA